MHPHLRGKVQDLDNNALVSILAGKDLLVVGHLAHRTDVVEASRNKRRDGTAIEIAQDSRGGHGSGKCVCSERCAGRVWGGWMCAGWEDGQRQQQTGFTCVFVCFVWCNGCRCACLCRLCRCRPAHPGPPARHPPPLPCSGYVCLCACACLRVPTHVCTELDPLLFASEDESTGAIETRMYPAEQVCLSEN